MQNRFIEGRAARLGYLSMLRLLSHHRGRHLTSQAFSYLKKQELGTRLFFASIVEGNRHALKILTRQRGDYPFFNYIADIITKILLLPPQGRNQKKSAEIDHAREHDTKAVLAFLAAEGRKKQFFPIWKRIEFSGLPLDKIVVARKGNRIIGVCAVWDQTAFRQVRMHSYGAFAHLACFYNWWMFKSLPNLPMPGETIKFSYISHLAIEQNDPDILASMIEYLRADARLSMLAIGLDARDPLLAALRGFPSIKYKSKLFLVSWEDQLSLALRLRTKLVYPEIALM